MAMIYEFNLSISVIFYGSRGDALILSTRHSYQFKYKKYIIIDNNFKLKLYEIHDYREINKMHH